MEWGQILVPDGQGVISLAAVAELQTPEGERLLAEASHYNDPLLAVSTLRRTYPAELVRAAVETVDLRRRAAAKVTQPGRMFFAREALEQASGETVALWRARRYAAYESVEDWGCGLGIDSLALAAVTNVCGLDLDPVRIALAQANARSLGIPNVEFSITDYLTSEPRGSAIWVDPSRRSEGRRETDPNAYTPPLNRIIERARGRPLGVKISPAVDTREIPADAEAEFISVAGELKECVLWFGELRSCRRRATILPSGITQEPSGTALPVGPPGSVLYDPDPAVVRAGAVSDLGLMLSAHPIDRTVAYLTGDSPVFTPLAQTLVVEKVIPWNLKDVKRHLREADERVEEIRKRGSQLDADVVRKALKTDGSNPVILVLTRVSGRPVAIVATRLKG